ncbi:hypothetical protein [Pseudomonas farris]
MTIYKKLTSAQQSRLDYQLIRLASPRMDGAPPEVHPDNPLLPDEVDDDINQLPVKFQGLPLKVNVPRPPEADDPLGVQGFIQLTWNGSRQVERYDYVTPLDPTILLIEMVLPENLTNVSGKHELGYYLNQGGNIGTVTPLVVNVDTTTPQPVMEIVVPPEVERDGITKKYMDDNGFVLLTVPEYAGRKLGDVVQAYIGTSLPLPTPIGEFTRTDLTLPVTFNLTAAMLGGEEGERAIYYYVSDRKGNKSRESPFKRLNVVLTDPPEGLLPPDIPQYSDSLIDLQDGQDQVGVGIKDEYTNFLSGDQLVVTWDGQLQAPETIPGFPFYVNVPFRAVFNGDAGPKNIDVSYQIKRNNVFHPLIPISMSLDVDLSKPGAPIDPDEPGPPNPNLALVTVQGQGGNGPNVLTAADADQTVGVSVVTYTGAKEDDEAQLFWKGVAVSAADGGVVTIPATPPAQITFDVEWSVIAAGGNGKTLPANYVITHPLNENKDISLPREVDVFIRDGVVPEVKFQHLDPDFIDWINCGSLRQDAVIGTVVEVLIAGGEAQLAGQTLTFTYQGYTDAAGSAEKPDTKVEVQYEPTDQDATNGFIVKIPYDPAVRLTENAWGGVSYSADIDGRPTPSARHLVRVYMVDPGGGTCPLP